ncbi:hypothetical protein [Intrasporangium chromatireducens]|uniref:hypothetical protein n=1 Tax=Intrasporangium chromatireducens TaxID=1386088 RepID=UPI0004B731D6|nr:hypothetical protein [Intrasporangium chromatireducens]
MTTHLPGNRHQDGHDIRGTDPAPTGTPIQPLTLGRHDQAKGGAPTPWRHRLMMLACCIPMLVLVIALVATGVAGSGAVLFALLCIGMMAAMMFLMPGGHRH